ncbi:MAG: type II secretion system protein [bacterium]|nr:type II secretion system protein [bacterium]
MHYQSQQGITLIEVIVAVAIAGMLIGSISTLTVISVRVGAQTQTSVRALFLAQEAMEAVWSIRDETVWEENGIGSFEVAQEYYPLLLSDPPLWELGEGVESIEQFTRSIMLEQVYRNANDDIAEMGTEDPDTRRVTVRVSWQGRNGEREETLTAYITNWRE